MKRNEILSVIRNFAMSQGFYGRLYEQLVDNDEALEYLEAQNFSEPLDIVFFFEQ